MPARCSNPMVSFSLLPPPLFLNAPPPVAARHNACLVKRITIHLLLPYCSTSTLPTLFRRPSHSSCSDANYPLATPAVPALIPPTHQKLVIRELKIGNSIIGEIFLLNTNAQFSISNGQWLRGELANFSTSRSKTWIHWFRNRRYVARRKADHGAARLDKDWA